MLHDMTTRATTVVTTWAPPGLASVLERFELLRPWAPDAIPGLLLGTLLGLAFVWARLRRRAFRRWADRVLASIDDAVVVLDRRDRVAIFNPAASRVFGWFTDAPVGRRASAVFADRPEVLDRLGDNSGSSQIRLDKSEAARWLDLRVSSLARHGRVLVLRDVTGRQRDEEERAERGAIVSLVRGIAAAANEAATVGQALAAALELVCEELGWPVGHAYLRAPGEPERLVSARVWHLRDPVGWETFRAMSEACRFARGEGIPGRVLATGRPAWVSDATADRDRDEESGRRTVLADRRERATFVLPLLVGAEVAGALEFFAAPDALPKPSFLEAIAQISAQLGRVLEREQARSERDALHDQLVEASHRSGRAEMATSVLHNVGNALNSVTLGLGRLGKAVHSSRLEALEQVASLLQEHEADLAGFLTEDSRGRLVPSFVVEATRELGVEHAGLRTELERLAKSVEHVTEIVRAQQSHAGPSVVVQDVSAVDLVENAIELSAIEGGTAPVPVERSLPDVGNLRTDRHAVLQILVNVLRNASEAVQGVATPRVRVELSADREAGPVHVRVIDNGVGISEEFRSKLFAQGSTTKERGRGLGLHSSLLAAQQLGGSLSAQSEGPGRGAAFSLELPREQGRSA